MANTPARVTDLTALSIVVTRDILPPSVPTALNAAPVSGSQINLTWGASTDTGGSGLKGYNVYRGGVLLAAQVSAASYSDTGLNASTAYSYQVSASDNAGNESTLSNTASATTLDITAPSVPLNLTATAISVSQINLAWSASTDTGGSGLKGYNVYRNGSLAASPTVALLNDTGLLSGTNYSYRVSAVDNAGNESAQSTAANATTLSSLAWQAGTITENLSVGTPFSVNLDTLCTNAQSYTLVGGSLPAGLSMSGGPRNNVISGVPTTVQALTPMLRARDTVGYTTNFSLTEASISEGGAWVSNGGGSWTPVTTTPGLACGTNGATNGFDDSNAHLLGFGANHTITATIFRAPSIPAGETHEVELFVRMTTSAGVTTGYEVDLDYNGNIVIVRWDGALGAFTVLSNTGGTGSWGGPPQNGDVFTAKVTGNTIQGFKGSTLVVQSTDSTWATGNPGIGFFKRTAGVNNLFGFSSLTATSP